MTCFRLLHLSDLHIAVKPREIGFPDRRYAPYFPNGKVRLIKCSSWDPRLGDNILARLVESRDLLDAVLITGDLATTGEQEDLGRAREFIDSLRRLAQTAPPGGGPPRQPKIIVLPGNHDRFHGKPKWAGCGRFDTTFAGEWQPVQQVALTRPA